MRNVALFALLFTLFASRPVAGMTADEAVAFAVQNNPELQAARLEEVAAKGRLEKATLLLINNPVVEGGMSKKEKEPGSEEKFRNYEVRLSQEFEIAGQRGLRIDAAEKDLLRIAQEIRDRERLLTADVKDAFARALASKRKKELALETVKLQEELLGFSRIKFQAGEISGLEVNLAEVEFGKAKRALLLAEQEHRESLFALQSLMGLKPDLAFGAEGELMAEAPAVPDREGLRNLMVSRRPDIQAAAAEVDATRSAAKLTGREAFPNITLSGVYEKDERRDAVGVLLSVPLPLFDRKQAERKEAQARAGQARIKQAGLEKTVENEFEEAYSNLASTVEELSLFRKEILDKALENLGLMNLAYREGKIGFFEVRLAQKDTIEAQFAYLESQLRTRLAVNALERVTGGILK